MEEPRYKIGTYLGEPAIHGPGGPYRYSQDELAEMRADCALMNAFVCCRSCSFPDVCERRQSCGFDA